MKNPTKQTKKSPATKSSGLLLSVSKIKQVKTRSEVAASDGGGTGRSDSNDK